MIVNELLKQTNHLTDTVKLLSDMGFKRTNEIEDVVCNSFMIIKNMSHITLALKLKDNKVIFHYDLNGNYIIEEDDV